jgi:hypothetical protein
MAAGSAAAGAAAGADVGAGGGGSGGAGRMPAHAASSAGSTSAAARCTYDRGMVLILLEALGALVLLIAIVWWTMFSGRKGGERRDE